jgi:hypothetical protein
MALAPFLPDEKTSVAGILLGSRHDTADIILPLQSPYLRDLVQPCFRAQGVTRACPVPEVSVKTSISPV